MGELARVAPGDRERLVARFGREVLDWCDELPRLVDELAARWSLEPVEAGGGGTSRVFRCLRADGTGAEVWLKLTPESAIAREEAEALRAWAGTPSVVTLLAEDPGAGALLLDGVRPGEKVRQIGWDLTRLGVLLRELRTASTRPAGSVLRPLSERIDLLFDMAERRLRAPDLGAPFFDPAVLGRARAAALELAGDGDGDGGGSGGGRPAAGLVHGDLHSANVLSGPGGRMVAIDPRPTWGDPDFDAVDWALEGTSDQAGLERRAAELAALVPGQSPERVLAWCQAMAALNALPRLRAQHGDAHTRFLVALAGAGRRRLTSEPRAPAARPSGRLTFNPTGQPPERGGPTGRQPAG